MSLANGVEKFYEAGGRIEGFVVGGRGQTDALAEIGGQIEELGKLGKLKDPGPNMASWAFERFQRVHHLPDSALLLVARNGAGEVAGLVEVEDMDQDPVWLMALGSFGTMAGVGSALVNGVLEEAVRRGKGVRVAAAKSQGFYEKMGYGLQMDRGKFYFGWDLAGARELIDKKSAGLETMEAGRQRVGDGIARGAGEL